MLSKRVLQTLSYSLRFNKYIGKSVPLSGGKFSVHTSPCFFGDGNTQELASIKDRIHIQYIPETNPPNINKDTPHTDNLTAYLQQLNSVTTKQIFSEVKNLKSYEEANLIFMVLSTRLKKSFNKMTHEEKYNFLLDESFQTIFSFFVVDNTNIPIHIWINVLKSFFNLGITDFELLYQIESLVGRMLDKLDIPDLLRLNAVYGFVSKDQKRSEIFDKITDVLKEKCQKTSRPSEVLSIMYVFAALKDVKGLEKVEESLLVLLPYMKITDVYKIIFISSTILRRNEKLIRAVTMRMNEWEDFDLSMNQVSNLLYACSVLSIYDEQLLNKTCRAARRHIEIIEEQMDFIYAIIISLARLRWKDADLLRECCKVLNENTSSFLQVKPDVMKNIFLAFARLNYNAGISEILDKKKVRYLHKKLTQPTELIDFVWSLAVLQKAKSRHFKAVLNDDFVRKLLDLEISEDDVYKKVSCHQKVQNINCEARMHGYYSGPYLFEGYEYTLPKDLICCDKRSQNLLLKSLEKMAPADKYLITTENPAGHSVEAILYVNDSGQPQQLSQSTDKHHKVCIKVQSFSETTLKNVGPNGSMSMAIRHLEFLGFKVVVVPYTLLSGKPKSLDIIQFLETGIKSALKKSP